jgi:hypothetical protein
MKNKIMIIVLLFSIITSCEPPRNPPEQIKYVKLNAILNNINGNVALGDTLKIALKLPDTIIDNRGDVQLVNSLQMGQFALYINKMDTINKKADLVSLITYWTTQGSLSLNSSFFYNMNTNTKPYGVVINFKPTTKGIYYLEVATQPTDLKINGNYDAKLIVGFNVINKHIDLITPFVTAGWVTEANTREPGIYVFRVI